MPSVFKISETENVRAYLKSFHFYQFLYAVDYKEISVFIIITNVTWKFFDQCDKTIASCKIRKIGFRLSFVQASSQSSGKPTRNNFYLCASILPYQYIRLSLLDYSSILSLSEALSHIFHLFALHPVLFLFRDQWPENFEKILECPCYMLDASTRLTLHSVLGTTTPHDPCFSSVNGFSGPKWDRGLSSVMP